MSKWRAHPLYGVYADMKHRCRNKNNPAYKHYGGRGIKVCDRWLLYKQGFINFLSDMGERPAKGYSLDRINNDGNYEPDNCRWATPKEQAANRRIGTNNTSGYKWVAWHKNSKRWRVTRVVDGKQKVLGSFVDKQDAIKASLNMTGLNTVIENPPANLPVIIGNICT